MSVNGMHIRIRGTHSVRDASSTSAGDARLVGYTFDVELGAIGLEEEFIALTRGQSGTQSSLGIPDSIP
jgi:hypothetical protein